MSRFCGIPGKISAHPKFPQLPVSSTPPLLPEVAPEPPFYPGIKFSQNVAHLGDVEVRLPAQHVQAEFFHDHLDASATDSAGYLPDPFLETFERFGADPTIQLREGKAQKLSLPGPVNRTLSLID